MVCCGSEQDPAKANPLEYAMKARRFIKEKWDCRRIQRGSNHETKIKVGIIGTDRIGKLHAENIRYNIGNVEITAITDIEVDSIRDWAEGLGIKQVYSDYREILNDPEIDAVLICSSTDTHSNILIEAADAGKHIFCEKPIDYDVNRIREALVQWIKTT